MNKLSHVAFIMDGNGRWGLQRRKGRNFGHFKGVRAVQGIVEKSIKLKIPIVTFYVFSTENWKRPKSEINFLFQLLINYFKEELDKVILNGIKVKILGKLNRLPAKIKIALKDVEKKTKKNKKIVINLAINYGSRDEIVEACKKTKNKINLRTLSKNLYTKNIPNPDILIRTGGHKRLSNFMLWQLAYTEIYFVDKLWPDFSGKDFEKITNNFKKVKRNFGSI